MAKDIVIFDAIHNFHQPENAYRFSADSIILAEFVEAAGAARLADLGAGCGIVGLSALEKGRAPAARDYFFVEVNSGCMEALAANLALYQPRTRARLHPVNGDWRSLNPDDFGGPLDYIMVNPPYFPQGSGRPSQNPGSNAARHEIHGGLPDLCAAIARLLAPKGRAALMMPIKREAELLGALKANGLEQLRISRPGQRLVLMEARQSS
jgi:tRNA1Val (adenine37-N6)-methyltransferase